MSRKDMNNSLSSAIMEHPLYLRKVTWKMPGKKKCCLCSYWLNGCRHLSTTTHDWFHEYLRANGKVFDEEDIYLYSSCVCQYYDFKKHVTISSATQSMDTSEDNDDSSDNDTLLLENVFFGDSGHKYLLRCLSTRSSGWNGDHAQRCPPGFAYFPLDVCSPYGVRCCAEHLFNNKQLKPNITIVLDNRATTLYSFLNNRNDGYYSRSSVSYSNCKNATSSQL